MRYVKLSQLSSSDCFELVDFPGELYTLSHVIGEEAYCILLRSAEPDQVMLISGINAETMVLKL